MTKLRNRWQEWLLGRAFHHLCKGADLLVATRSGTKYARLNDRYAIVRDDWSRRT